MTTPESPVTADTLRTVHKALLAAQEALKPVTGESEELRLCSYKIQEALSLLKNHGSNASWGAD